MLLNYLLLSRCCRGCHGPSNNKGNDNTDDDADKDDDDKDEDDKDKDEDNDDEDNNDDSIITQPSSPIVKHNAPDKRNAHFDVDVDADDDDAIVERNAREERNAHCNIDDNTDNNNDATITWRSLPLSRYEEFLQCRAWFATNSSDYNGDNNSNNGETDEDNDDSSIGSISSVDFDGVDSGSIIEDLQLICQNGRIHSSTGSYFTVDSNFFFTESDICFTVQHFPRSFLRQYFEGPWPNFH